MVLVYTNKDWKGYLRSLHRKHGRWIWQDVQRRNAELTYHRVEWDRDKVETFMNIWSKQLVRGNSIEWAYGVGHVEDLWNQGRLAVFEARDGDRVFAMQFIEKQDGYWECHPPMWDKAGMLEKNLGTWMWFRLIQYAIEEKLGILNLGGGVDSSWREMLKRRNEFPNPKYKFRFVPLEVKDNPDLQPDYSIKEGCPKILSIN